MQKLGLDVGWSSDLQCGNFDLKTTVGNQINGMTNGFKNLMGDVVQSATGAVASLSAMVIQRANPGLYEMLTNGVLQANVAFDKAQLNCQNIAKCIVNFSDSSKWTQQDAMDEYKKLVNSGDADALRVNDSGEKVTGESGSCWGGGRGQRAIRPTHDLSAAGYDMMNNLPVNSTGSGSFVKFPARKKPLRQWLKCSVIARFAPVRMPRNAPMAISFSNQAPASPKPAFHRCWKKPRALMASNW